MDVSNAFLKGDLDEVVFMKMPHAYTGFGSRKNSFNALQNLGNEDNMVSRLKKALYGLRQAKWFPKLSLTLKIRNYAQSKADYSLFSYREGDQCGTCICR